MCLGAIERREQKCDRFHVGLLLHAGAGLVHTVVDMVVDPIVGLFGFHPQVCKEQIDLCVLGRQQLVEFGVQHPKDFAGFVAHDLVGLGVVEKGHGVASAVLRTRGLVRDTAGTDVFT